MVVKLFMPKSVGRSRTPGGYAVAIKLAFLLLLLHSMPVWAATNQVAFPDGRAESVRNDCLQGRRQICGRVLQVLPDGLVVDSGYSSLLNPPFNQSWVVRGSVSAKRDPSLVEEKRPDAIAVGPVCLTDLPKRPSVKIYDYVVIRGYPAGKRTYTPVPGVQKELRRFSASLDRAVKINLQAGEGSQSAPKQ
jgi:hypothetical protein